MEPPEKPDENDCCGSGCNPCILDVYENELKRHSERQKRLVEDVSKINVISTIKYNEFVLKFVEKHGEYLLMTFESIKSGEFDLKYNAGQYFILRSYDDNSAHFTRPYTPLGRRSMCFNADWKPTGIYFQIVVKLYKDGLMSGYLASLSVGDVTMWRGPYGDYKYRANTARFILFVAQGTAVVSALAIINEILDNEDDETRIMLMYCSRSIDDVIFRKELSDYSKYWNFKYEIYLSKSTDDVRYMEPVKQIKLSKGRVKEYLNDKTTLQVIVSGGDEFMKHFKQIVIESGVGEDFIHCF